MEEGLRHSCFLIRVRASKVTAPPIQDTRVSDELSSNPSAEPASGAEEPAPGIARFLKPKSRYRRSEGEEDDATKELDEVALLSTALEIARRRQQSGELARSTAQSVNRFIPAAEPLELPSPAAAEGGEPEPRSLEGKAKAALPLFKAGRTDRQWRTGAREGWPWRRLLLGLAAAAAMALAGFLAGKRSAAAPGSAPGQTAGALTAGTWRPQDSTQVAAARAAERAGDLSAALRTMNILGRTVELSPGLRAYRATLSTRVGYFNDAEADLSRLISPNTPPDVSVVVQTARAFNFVRWRRFGDALECFAEVNKADPADVTNLLNWAETLRRKGSLAEAIDRFQQALSRSDVNATPYTQPQREYMDYARRLTLIENGRAAELQPEVAARLSDPAPAGYWWLTAAAAALEKKDMPAAVDALQKARAIIAPEQFRLLLDDYYFRTFMHHPELNAFLVSASPEQQQARQLSLDYFVDP